MDLRFYSFFHGQDFCFVSEKVGHLFTFSSPKMGVIITDLLVSPLAFAANCFSRKDNKCPREVGAIQGYHDAFPLIANNYTVIFLALFLICDSILE